MFLVLLVVLEQLSTGIHTVFPAKINLIVARHSSLEGIQMRTSIEYKKRETNQNENQ
jgi:hypothetical protein